MIISTENSKAPSGNARISFDSLLGDIIAEWDDHTDKISSGVVYLTIAQAEHAKRWGWKMYGTQTFDEEARGLVKVER